MVQDAAVTEMPRRPRTHVLESEARLHFRSLVEPHGWVVREQDRLDYGIDDSVEIFDDGVATGLTFLVQSRGTDKVLPQALKVKIRPAQQNYFRAFADPVLIVRYHSPTRRTLAKWFHTVDPYPRRDSQTITLSLEDELGPDGVKLLATEVRRFRAFKSANLQWPLRVVIETEGLPQRSIRLAVGRSLRNHPGILSVVDEIPQRQPALFVRITADRVVVHAGIASHTAHASTENLTTDTIAGLIVYGAAIILDNLGHTSRAADLFEAYSIAEIVPPDPLRDIGVRLGRARRMDNVFRIVARYRAVADPLHLAAATTLLIHSTANHESDVSALRISTELLETLCEHHLLQGTPLAGSGLVSAARMRFAVGDWSEADRLYSAAGKVGADVESQQDLLAELAGAAHENHDYLRAVSLYDRAVEMEPSRRDLLPRRADSLMRSGDFERAREDLLSYHCSSAEVTTFSRLLLAALDFIVKCKFKEGPYDSMAALRVAQARGADESDTELIARCLRAAALDPWCATAWAELGHRQYLGGRYGLAYGPLLIDALVTRSPEAWARLFVAAYRDANDDFAHAAVTSGAGDYDDEFHHAVAHVVSADDDAEVVCEKADAIDLSTGRWRRYRQGPTVSG